ncbi:MAG: acetyl-CoA carboxylase biotin carboxyl carrier protein [Verrucomicrobia bacterium]|nr:acetyl-CoA carboxylase biotin carboxyl carrier protein [Verrucomicrobiota bacterium]
MDLKDIKAIIDLMKKNSISEFEMERQDFKIRLRRGGNSVVQAEDVVMAPGLVSALPSQLPQGALALPHAPGPVSPVELDIKSPMIGTFYRAPSPESAPYVEVGTEVNAETVVCIIEAMKVMNEIKAEMRGVVTQILLENAKPVEFGQPIFRIRPL